MYVSKFDFIVNIYVYIFGSHVIYSESNANEEMPLDTISAQPVLD